MHDAIADLRRLTQRLFRRFGALSSDSTPCGKPLPLTHAHALMILLERGALTQQQLGAELGIDKSNVARLCAKMEHAGDVRQRPGPNDARSRIVHLSNKGARVAAEVNQASRMRFASLLEHLPMAERDRVIDALRVLVEAVDALTEPAAQRAVPS